MPKSASCEALRISSTGHRDDVSEQLALTSPRRNRTTSMPASSGQRSKTSVCQVRKILSGKKQSRKALLDVESGGLYKFTTVRQC
jgi:hypothetical protein